MISNIISRKVWLPTFQQLRYAKKTFKLRHKYGEAPLFHQDDFIKAEKEGRLNDLSYKNIRFSRLWESDSPLFDHDYEMFVRYVMRGGRKELAYDLMHRTFYEVKCMQFPKLRKQLSKKDSESTESDETKNLVETNPMTIFKTALKNCEPVVITRKVKRGGAIYQVPYPLVASQKQWYAVRWLIDAVKERPKRRTKLFPEVMAQELLDAYHNRGKVIKKRDDIHRLADANKAYAHYRWG